MFHASLQVACNFTQYLCWLCPIEALWELLLCGCRGLMDKDISIGFFFFEGGCGAMKWSGIRL
jgi:hypothetical protein